MEADTERMIAKVKKLLALSRSSNEAEAAAALCKAKELMEKYSITDTAIRLADITESKAKASVAERPARWEDRLAGVVGRAFGCRVIFWHGGYGSKGPHHWYREKGRWQFIAADPIPDIAAYAFQVVLRQVSAQRSAYVAALPTKLKRVTKIRRGDLFAEAWVSAASRKVSSFAGQDRRQDIDAWVENHHPNLGQLTVSTRTDKVAHHDHRAWDDGYEAGANVRLDHAVGEGARPAMIGRL